MYDGPVGGRTRAVVIGLAALAALGGCREVTSPEPPDMSGTVAAYDAPTAALDVELARIVAERAVESGAVIEDVDGLSVVGAAVNGFQPGAAPGVDAGPPAPVDAGTPGIAIGDTVINGNGYLNVTHRCDGWDGDPGEPGDMQLYVLVVDSTIFEVVWGEMHRCRFSTGAEDVEVDGFVAVHLDERITVQAFEPEAITARIAGSVLRRGEASPTEIDFDFRVRLEGQIDVRIVGPGNTHVIATAGVSEWSIRATNGTFGCDFGMRRCGNLDSGEVITW